ncbi:MAG TPA: hypothetical protein VIL41_00365 [Coriobacteriia bacterium]
MRTLRSAVVAAVMVALLCVAGCSAAPSASPSSASPTSTPTATAVATGPVGPILVGSSATTMPDVIGLNLRIASERFAGIGQGARLFTEKYHGIWASQAYGSANQGDLGDPVVTTTSPAPGAALHGDNLYLGTGPLALRRVAGKTVGPWYFEHGLLVRSANDHGCWGCHAPEDCRRCHPGYKVGTAGMAHPPVTVESVLRERVAALHPDKKLIVSRVLVSGTDGYAVDLVYADPAVATPQARASTEAQLAKAVTAAKLRGVGELDVIWSDSAGRLAASDRVPLR